MPIPQMKQQNLWELILPTVTEHRYQEPEFSLALQQDLFKVIIPPTSAQQYI